MKQIPRVPHLEHHRSPPAVSETPGPSPRRKHDTAPLLLQAALADGREAIAADGRDQSRLVVRLTAGENATPLPARTVCAAVPAESGGTVEPASVVTDEAGTAFFTYTASTHRGSFFVHFFAADLPTVTSCEMVTQG